jgi:hypothetical protein
MNDEKFALEALKRVVDENINSYREMLSSFPREDARDPYWIKLFSLFDSMSVEDRDLLVQIMRQVSIDTIASLLSIIDGSGYSDLKGLRLVDGNGNDIQGDLSNIFLSRAENT